MTPSPFHLPVYPRPTQFSDPYHDWMYDSTPGETLRKQPDELSAHTLSFIFNWWLPMGTFEEMAAYVPHALELLLHAAEDDDSAELLENLIVWCHVESEAMAQDPAFLAGMQEAFLHLFKLWTSEANPLYADHIEHLLKLGDYIEVFHRTPLPWLCSAHFLPHLLELDSLPHAAWLLRASDEDVWSQYPPLALPPATRLAAMDMVEDWLLSTATQEDIEYWDPIVTHTHDYFLRHPVKT